MHDEQEVNSRSLHRPSAALPAIRPLEITAFRGSNNELYFSMFDMSRIAPQPVAISLPGYFVVAHLDGRRTVAEIQAAFAAEFGREIEAEQIERVVRALDEALLLNSDNFDRAHAAAAEAYRSAEVCDNRDRWPPADELRAEIEGMFARADSRGTDAREAAAGARTADARDSDERARRPAPLNQGQAPPPVERASVPASEPAASVPASEPAASAPASEPAAPVPVSEPAASSPAGGHAAPMPPSPYDITGLMAPHLDYARGGPCYVDAYQALLPDALRSFKRFVILGTNHFGRAGGIVATRKDFLTPLGRVATDHGFLDALESRLDEPLCLHEFDHAAEHSIELHVHILQTLLMPPAGTEARPTMDGAEDRTTGVEADFARTGSVERASVPAPVAPFTIVPLLIPDPTGPTGTRPLDGIGPDLLDFARALRELLRETDRRTLMIASADLSHVGERFGEPAPTDHRFMKAVARSDKRLLELLENRREEEFVVALAANGNPTRICSIGCLFVLLCALPNRPCRVLRYHQALDFDNETHVTCAAGIVA